MPAVARGCPCWALLLGGVEPTAGAACAGLTGRPYVGRAGIGNGAEEGQSRVGSGVPGGDDGGSTGAGQCAEAARCGSSAEASESRLRTDSGVWRDRVAWWSDLFEE
ncbi:hypothetical protein GCM10010171_20740 [Actinokineospora fastidiosa]|uniref:Uncharacterized protein n=1 Tax=Actinokineospora fastidiosa TaxID=1816 RepID=A0A918GC25_9PSEU|nr:hypothetical protein GCM10010171_20740 [Actinokineospora fastidiosa]